MQISIVHADALTSLGYGQDLLHRLAEGECGLRHAQCVFNNVPSVSQAGMVGTVAGIEGTERLPQLFDSAFQHIMPDLIVEADMIIGGCSLGDLTGQDAGNPHAALSRALARQWPGNKSLPAISVVSSACSSATDALIMAAHAVQTGLADVVGVIGFDSLEAGKLLQHIALGTQSADRARPFDAARSGTSFAEACGVMILASKEGLAKLQCRPIGQIAGFGMSADAHDIAAPHPDGLYAAQAISAALRDIDLTTLGYINAHGSGTLLNDRAESLALTCALGDYTPYASIGGTKGALGHSLGATGIVEAVVTLNALTQGIYPRTTGLSDLDPEIGIPVLQRTQKRHAAHRYGLSATFGFGGVNSAVLMALTE